MLANVALTLAADVHEMVVLRAREEGADPLGVWDRRRHDEPMPPF